MLMSSYYDTGGDGELGEGVRGGVGGGCRWIVETEEERVLDTEGGDPLITNLVIKARAGGRQTKRYSSITYDDERGE